MHRHTLSLTATNKLPLISRLVCDFEELSGRFEVKHFVDPHSVLTTAPHPTTEIGLHSVSSLNLNRASPVREKLAPIN